MDRTAHDLLEIIHELIDLAEDYSDHRRTFSGRQLIVALLFFRLIEATEAVVLLCRFGYEGEAAIVSRSQLEIVVNLVLCCNEDGYFEKYMSSQRIHQKKQASALAASENPLLSDWKDRWSAAIVGLEAAGEAMPLGKFEARCARAGLKEYYDVVYRSHSVDAHAQPISLMRHVVLKSGEPNKIVLLPSLENSHPEHLLYLSCELLLRGMYAFLRQLGVVESQRVEDLRSRLEEYGQNHVGGGGGAGPPDRH